MGLFGRISQMFLGNPASPPEGPQPGEGPSEYGQLAGGRNMAEELRKRAEAEKAREAAAQERPIPRLWGYERAERRFLKRLRGDYPGWSKSARFVRRLGERLETAAEEGPGELRHEARRAVVSRRGLFQRLKRHMTSNLDQELDRLREKGASEKELRRHESRWWNQYRGLGKIERRLRRPQRFIRF